MFHCYLQSFHNYYHHNDAMSCFHSGRIRRQWLRDVNLLKISQPGSCYTKTPAPGLLTQVLCSSQSLGLSPQTMKAWQCCRDPLSHFTDEDPRSPAQGHQLAHTNLFSSTWSHPNLSLDRPLLNVPLVSVPKKQVPEQAWNSWKSSQGLTQANV